MFEPGFLKWRYFKVLFLFHAVVLYFMTTPLSNVFSNWFKWTIVLLVSYALMAIPFVIAMRIPWITADGRREFAALSVVGLVRGFGILDVGLLLDLPQVQPYLLRPLNSSVSVPLWFLIIRFIIGSQGEFQKLFHELYVRNIRDKVTSVIPINRNLRESEIESVEAQVRKTLEPLKKQIEEVSGIELDKESLKKESLIIQSFIEDRLRPLSHDLWRQQQINPPRLNYLNFLLRLLFTTKSQFGLAIFPAFIYVLVGLTTLIDFDFALRHSLLNLLVQVFIFLVFEYTYSRAKRLKNYLNIIAILLCAIIPAFLDEIFLGSIYSETIPTFVEFIGVGWFLALSLAFSVAKAQTDYRKEIIGILLKDIEQPFFDNQEDKIQIAEKYAKSREGKAQVELAQMSYMLPRLRGWGESLSRQAGGIGGRGPGETKIETDRRRINDKMTKLRREIKEMKISRDTKRQERRKNNIPSVAITGYTNAGKSSLLNRLTGADVLVENALFATLDPTVRKCETNDGRIYTLVDTVGFVRHLPHQLVEAFKSTLEEVSEADLIVHVVDGAHTDPFEQIRAVREVIREIGGSEIMEIIAINKADIAPPEKIMEILRKESNAYAISARTGYGLENFIKAIEVALPKPKVEINAIIPFNRGDLVSAIHEQGEIISEEYLPEGTKLHAMVGGALARKIELLSVIN